MINRSHIYCLVILPFLAFCLLACSKSSPPVKPPVSPPATLRSDVSFWLTNPDKSALFRKQNVQLNFTNNSNANPVIEVDTTTTFQSIDGFGFTLTGGSASLIKALPESQQEALLTELFATDSTNIGISYLRISIGASDLSAETFTYDDLPAGQTDVELQNFSLNKERDALIPVLKKIIAKNPAIKILGSPWSAPTWMKSNNSFIGGSLEPQYFHAYAQYFVKYIQAMKAEGIVSYASTSQN